jgi:hypothetical protein
VDDVEELNDEQRAELEELTAFIDAHGGRLGPFRGWRAPDDSVGVPADE